MDSDDVKRKMIDLLTDTDSTIVLSTVDAAGLPHSRFMGGLTVEGGKHVYMATYRSASKLDHLKSNPHCQLLAAPRDWEEIVTLNGKAELEESAEKKRAIWNAHPAFKTYFSGVDSPDYALIKMTLASGEYLLMERVNEPVEVSF